MKPKTGIRTLIAVGLVATAVTLYAAVAWTFVTYFQGAAEHVLPPNTVMSSSTAASPHS